MFRAILHRCAFLLLTALPVLSLRTQPAWWSARGVASGQADDYAVANLGQLKALATSAAVQMEQRLSGGAGATIRNLITSWRQPAPIELGRDDYAALNQGQLKTVADLYYDHLGLSRPWTGSTADDDDYALVNLGQLKYVFSFVIAASGDADGDGLDDAWENIHFGGTDHDGDADAETTPDGLSNLAEYHAGTDPLVSAETVSAASLGLVVYSP